jgi:four helix bundle protein
LQILLKAAFINRLNDAEAEAAETQTWLDFAFECGYLSEDKRKDLWNNYDHVIGKIVNMIIKPSPWILPKQVEKN